MGWHWKREDGRPVGDRHHQSSNISEDDNTSTVNIIHTRNASACDKCQGSAFWAG
jgi:hypothetical protein